MVPTVSPQDLEQGSFAPPLATGIIAGVLLWFLVRGFDLLSLSSSMIDPQVRVSEVGSSTSNLHVVFMDDSGVPVRMSKSSVFLKLSLVQRFLLWCL